MEITLAPNVLHTEQQTLTIDKVATLIGENGSGKSTILQSVFEKKLNNHTDFNHLRVICFSSGQNENFSVRFGRYLKAIRRNHDELNLDCFYYDKSWAKLLIFLSTSIHGNGHVRRFLREGGYVEEEEVGTDVQKKDVSTKLQFKFRVPRDYAEQIQQALRDEESGRTDTIRSTPYFRTLESFVAQVISNEYDFDETLNKASYEMTTEDLFKISFDNGLESDVLVADDGSALMDDVGEPLKGVPGRGLLATSFFTQLGDTDYLFDRNSINLFFKGGLEMDLLSDGEYQLLFLYALIDLFDSPNTLFLLDEADSHLHYQNIDRLWKVLGGIAGKSITTTHLLDSITANDFHSLKVVERGRISEEDKLKQLIKRLKVLSHASSVEFEICAKLSHMALLDDYNDWHIFLRLAERKGLDVSRLHSVQAFKKTSSYRTATESFGKAKIQWLENLGKVKSEFCTTQIFLICDRDEAPLDFDPTTGVKVRGREYSQKINGIQWPDNAQVQVHLLAWKRREIKNYLLSYTAFSHYRVLDQINTNNLAAASHLSADNAGDNDEIRRLKVKDVIDPLINEEGVGLCMEKLQAYIDLIPSDEISEDIENMYNYIVSKI